MSGFLKERDPLTAISSTAGVGKFEFLGDLETLSSNWWCVLVVENPDEICGGAIGSAGKFCVKASLFERNIHSI